MKIGKKALIVPLLGAVLLTLVSSVALVNGSSIFSATFENPNNNFAQFDGTSGSPCTVQSSVVYSGNYAAKLDIADDNLQYFFKSLPSTSTISVQFSLYIADVLLVQNDPLVCLTVYDDSSRSFSVVIDTQGAVPRWGVADGITGSSFTNNTATVNLNAWNSLLFTVAKGGEPGSEILQLYVNGELTCKLAGAGDGNGLNQVWFTGQQLLNTLSLYFDSINIDNRIVDPSSSNPTPSPSPTPSPTQVPTPTPTASPTPSPSPTPTSTPSPTPTPTPTPTLTPTPTTTVSPSLTPTPTPTPSPTPALSQSPSPTASPTPTPSTNLTSTPTASPSLSPTLTPAATPVPTPVQTNTPTASPSPSLTPTPTIPESETKSAQGFPYAIPLLSVAAVLFVLAFLINRFAGSKKLKAPASQFGVAVGQARDKPSKSKRANEDSKPSEVSPADIRSLSVLEDGKSGKHPPAPKSQGLDPNGAKLAFESQQSVSKSNGCPKNLEYFSLRPRPKQMPEECLTCPNLLTCVCQGEH